MDESESEMEIKPKMVDGEPICSKECLNQPGCDRFPGQYCIIGIMQQRNEWRKALQSLTPQGSEFQTPQECVVYVRDLLKSQKDTIHDLIEVYRNRPNVQDIEQELWVVRDLFQQQSVILKSIYKLLEEAEVKAVHHG